ncbi:MAG: RNHCP domain-containing protein, partial [Patescibacteria group bacterium]
MEDFVCAKCGTRVKGTGYTDHCPKCLWSYHVDINPGDRLAKCRGLMEPISVEVKGSKNSIYYQCRHCGFKHRVKAAVEDDID